MKSQKGEEIGFGSGEMGKWWKIAAAGIAVVGIAVARRKYGVEEAVRAVEEWSERVGVWAIPAYVGIHTMTLCLCLPYAVLMEAAASVVFGFWRGVGCVFAAKVAAASISFGAARMVVRRWGWAMEKARGNSYFNMLSRGVERDGWRFVLLARFSPVPSYVINYALAATKVRFFLDFLLPTALGCLPMILQNASIGTLAAAAGASSVSSYVFPVLGILSSLVISWRIKIYSAPLSM